MLVEAGIVIPRDFRQRIPSLTEMTDRMIQHVCTTSSMRAIQAQNSAGFRASGAAGVPHPFESMLMWGTVGYLARAHSERLVYSGHPLRSRVLSQTVFRLEPDAVAHTHEWVRAQRVRLIESLLPARGSRVANFILPPVAVEVVEASSSISQLVSIALQMRNAFAPLRSWLSRFQKAIEDEDPRSLMMHNRDLSAVADAITAMKNSGQYGTTDLEMRVNWIEQGAPTARPPSARALLGHLTLAPSGKSTLKKLLRLMGEERSSLGQATLEYLTQHYGQSGT